MSKNPFRKWSDRQRARRIAASRRVDRIRGRLRPWAEPLEPRQVLALLISTGASGTVGTGNVLRYNDANGQFIDTFVAASSGGLQNPRGIDFGPDGNLYVADVQ